MPEQHGESWATSPDVGGPLALLQRVTARMTVHHEIDEVLRAITGGLVQSVDAALARIWLYTSAASCPRCRELPRGDPAGGAPSLHLCASAGMFDGDAGPHHCVPLGMFLGGRVAETREAMLLNDLASERRVRSLPWIAQAGLRAYAGYPLLFHGELEGVLVRVAVDVDHLDTRRDRIARLHRLEELEVLGEVDRAGARQPGADDGGDQARGPDAGRDRLLEHRRGRVRPVRVHRVVVPDRVHERADVAVTDAAGDLGAVADCDRVDGQADHARSGRPAPPSRRRRAWSSLSSSPSIFSSTWAR